MKNLVLFCKWLLTGFFVLMTAGMIGNGSFLSAAIFFILIYLVMPLRVSQEFVNNIVKNSWIKVLLCVILFFIACFVAKPTTKEVAETSEPTIADVDSSENTAEPINTEQPEANKEDSNVLANEIVETPLPEVQENSSLTDVPADKSIEEMPDNNLEKETENLHKTYVLNTNSKKIHTPDCDSVEKIKESNKEIVEVDDISELYAQGYEPCSKCNPY